MHPNIATLAVSVGFTIFLNNNIRITTHSLFVRIPPRFATCVHVSFAVPSRSIGGLTGTVTKSWALWMHRDLERFVCLPDVWNIYFLNQVVLVLCPKSGFLTLWRTEMKFRINFWHKIWDFWSSKRSKIDSEFPNSRFSNVGEWKITETEQTPNIC